MMATRVFVLWSGNPVSTGKIPYVPTLHAQADSAGDHYHCDSDRPHRHWREAKLTQKVQKSEHDQGMHAEFVAEHALHLERSHPADRDVVNNGRAKVDTDARAQSALSPDCGQEFDNCDPNQ